MSRITIRYDRNPGLSHYGDTNTRAPSYQRLRLIDLSGPARRVILRPKSNGDQVFTVNSVVKKFGMFEHVKRYSQYDNWETLNRYPIAIELR